MDPAVAVAAISLIGTLITGIIGAIVALSANRAEKRLTAENTVERVLREQLVLEQNRVVLRDEEIESKDERILELEDENRELTETLEVRDFVIRELREQLNLFQRNPHADEG